MWHLATLRFITLPLPGAGLNSPALEQRLSTGAVVEEVALQENRLQFRRGCAWGEE